jgi:molybdopterin-containing oxidoreductase family iron-sulfur binding subunit
MPQVKELPMKGSQLHGRGGTGLNRRQALSLLATGIASSLVACSKPDEQIIPYVKMPERVVPGEALKFATTLTLSGFGRGVIVTSVDGRPIKVEGNPRHPDSLGATDVFAEAAVLSLYDPDRSRTVLHNGAIASYEQLRQAQWMQLQQMRASAGEGFRLLTGRTTSPTLLRQIDDLLRAFPQATWHAYDPIDQDSARAGSMLAYGQQLRALAHLDRARILVSLDADPLGHGPEQLRHARGFAAGRSTRGGDFSRIYALEAAPTLTGAKADHRIALHPNEIGEVAVAIAKALGAPVRDPMISDAARAMTNRIIADLDEHDGAGLVFAGSALSDEMHALVHWINGHLHAPIDLIPFDAETPSGRQAGSLSDLTGDLAAGKVDQLVMIGVNPAYDAPADLELAVHARKPAFRLHAGCYADETADLSNWHIPLNHVVESWSDARSSDGTASVVQPLIRPLYRTMTDHAVIALLMGQDDARPYDLVRETWRSKAGPDFEAWWARMLHDGVIAGSAAQPIAAAEPKLPAISAAPARTDAIAVVVRPDPSIWDGSFANNAWLQECPKPLTKQVWGNALALHPRDAERIGVSSGEVVTVTSEGRKLDTPVLIDPSMPIGVASVTLGLGRSRAGAIGNGVGANAYAIRSSKHLWTIPEVTIAKAGRRDEILTTQNVVRTAADVRELYPVRRLSDLDSLGAVKLGEKPSLMPQRPRPAAGHAWAMVIDTSVCIGCNACVVACQAENNVPVVGPEEVARGRDMHWLRVDVYDHGTSANPQLGFQPVPCMHCEHAPCEPVCPVAASVHDGEGLNVQVYNRCVGTRFCEANCPYKVRRFNFFGYADGEEYANLGLESYRGQKNPEVTVRARGVMEKCTYCVQRISAARRAAEREDRPIGTDEVRTACQSACPTQAISFGDLDQKESAIHQQKSDPRHYALLEHLGTRPRTTYLADIRNPASGLGEDSI